MRRGSGATAVALGRQKAVASADRALAGFDDAMLFVSHDREFLRGLSNRVLQPEDASHGPESYRGGYTEWVETTGQEAPGVHR